MSDTHGDRSSGGRPEPIERLEKPGRSDLRGAVRAPRVERVEHPPPLAENDRQPRGLNGVVCTSEVIGTVEPVGTITLPVARHDVEAADPAPASS